MKDCNKKVLLKKTLLGHKRCHTIENSFSCDVCEKSFKKRSQFVAHHMIHTGEKPFSCDICDKRFLRINGLTSHKLTHRSESLYCCKICNKTFRNINNLNTHRKRKHVKKKPHACDTCEKTFALPCDLRLHQRIHTGERPYCCAVCGQNFKSCSNLSRHKKRIHVNINELMNCNFRHTKNMSVELKNLKAEFVNDEWVLSNNYLTESYVKCLEDIKDEKDIKVEVIEDKELITMTVDLVVNSPIMSDII